MRKLTFPFVLLALLCSCSPQVFTMKIEMRGPSSSGIDLAGKTLSVVYLDDLSGRDEAFSPAMAESFSQALEKDYFSGNKAVEMYRMEKDFGGDYAARDTLVNLVMDTGDDVIFLFEAPAFDTPVCGSRSPVVGVGRDSSNVMQITVPYKIKLYVYDSMGQDTVKVYSGSSDFSEKVFCSPDESDEDVCWRAWSQYVRGGVKAGISYSRHFLSTWKPEQFTFFYCDSPQAWNTGGQAAFEYRWHDAIQAWMTLLDTKNMEKRSCAEYNIATACYLIGDYELAQKWLDLSDKDFKVYLSSGLRSRINAKLH